ncbi:MAG: hypothetical protein J6S02_02570 [Bacteroidaceae bacterium]|nr:hypothetical protein [Bacteroidaceae bacterium]
MNKSFLVIFGIVYATLALAQNDIISNITWLRNDTTYIYTHPNTIIYEYSDNIRLSPELMEYSNKQSQKRNLISYVGLKQKKIKKSTQFKVRGFANTTKKLHYDTYIVEFKNRFYCLPSENVENNIVIDCVNTNLDNAHNELIIQKDSCFKKFNLEYSNMLNSCMDSLIFYKKYREQIPEIIDSIKDKIHNDFLDVHDQILEEWQNSLPTSTKNIFNNVLSINQVTLHSPNSAGGCDCTVYYTNKSAKTIKYLYWSGDFYNAVNDLVSCEIRRSYSFTGKDTGPVERDKTGGGTWDCVIYDWSASYIKLTDIHIVYMDGSTVLIGAADIRRLLAEPQWDQVIQRMGGSEYTLVDNAVKKYEEKRKTIYQDIHIWTKRLNSLKHKDFKVVRDDTDQRYIQKLKYLSYLQQKYKSAEEILNEFELKNFIK